MVYEVRSGGCVPSSWGSEDLPPKIISRRFTSGSTVLRPKSRGDQSRPTPLYRVSYTHLDLGPVRELVAVVRNIVGTSSLTEVENLPGDRSLSNRERGSGSLLGPSHGVLGPWSRRLDLLLKLPTFDSTFTVYDPDVPSVPEWGCVVLCRGSTSVFERRDLDSGECRTPVPPVCARPCRQRYMRDRESEEWG